MEKRHMGGKRVQTFSIFQGEGRSRTKKDHLDEVFRILARGRGGDPGGELLHVVLQRGEGGAAPRAALAHLRRGQPGRAVRRLRPRGHGREGPEKLTLTHGSLTFICRIG